MAYVIGDDCIACGTCIVLSKKILFSYIKRKKAFFLERFFCFMLMCSCWCNYLSRPCGKKNKIAGGNSIMNMM